MLLFDYFDFLHLLLALLAYERGRLGRPGTTF
jgi:hypothetical protein